MNNRDDVINICSYFFEVLLRNYIKLENAVHKQSGLFSLFKKIDYSDRSRAFNGLLERAQEANQQLQLCKECKDDFELNALVLKLTECLALYMNMTNAQVYINEMLNQKALGNKYEIGEYSTNLKHFNSTRNALETELPKLQSLYKQLI